MAIAAAPAKARIRPPLISSPVVFCSTSAWYSSGKRDVREAILDVAGDGVDAAAADVRLDVEVP